MDIAPVPPAARADAVRVLVAAFWDYPETVHLLPDPGRRRRVMPRYLASDVADTLRHGTVLGATVGGALVGVAAWLPPGGYPIGWSRQVAQAATLVPAVPWGISVLREASRGRGANRARHPDGPHVWLRTLGVVPDHQGTGVGGALLAAVLAAADEGGVGCYLTTATAENAAWYHRGGFFVSEQFHPTPAWPTVWSMWREPA